MNKNEQEVIEDEFISFWDSRKESLGLGNYSSDIVTWWLEKFTLYKAELLSKLPDYKLNSGYMEYGDKKTFAEGWNMCKNEVRDIITNLTDGK